MERIVAYCGLVCSQCKAYLATQANDPEALERVAAEWRVEHNAPGIVAATVPCDGCPGSAGRKCFHCAECDIRACGLAAGVENCSACAAYPCARLERFFTSVPAARAVLDGLRA
ncbi:MAG: DUF3795 domain-containing protein [Chloroflexi bacterium]|jgi:hypothetical protein|nr:DUF3795 domain-containing protein [Chloroflexota bacterium]